MKKKSDATDAMRRHYDFSKGVVGKYVERLRSGSNVVVLDPDVADRFRTSQSVNRALRAYLKSRKTTGRKRSTKRSPRK